jgi:hypothetical protein
MLLLSTARAAMQPGLFARRRLINSAHMPVNRCICAHFDLPQGSAPKCECLVIGGAAHIAPKRRHGHLTQAVFDKIAAALAKHGVELLPEGGSFGSGVRWTLPRDLRR